MKPVDPRLLRYARTTRVFLAATVVLGLAGAGLVIAQAMLIAEIVVRAFQHHTPPTGLTTPLVLLAAVSLGRALVSWLTELAAHRSSAAVKSELRLRLLAHTTAHTTARPDRPTGELANLATRGIDALDDYFARYLPQLALAVVVPAALIARILTDDWISAATIAVTLPLIPVFMILIGWATQARTDRQWRLLSRLSGHFLDVVAGLPTLKVFGRAKAQAENIRAITADYRRATLRTLRIAFLSSFALELLSTISVALVAVGIGMRLVHGELDLYTGLVVLILAPEAYLPLRQVGVHYHAAAEGLAAAEDVFSTLETDAPAPGTAPAPDARTATIALDGLTVRHEGRTTDSLPPTTLTVAPGENVAVTGPSGAGKTTLLSALLGLTTPTAGRVLIAGRDLSTLSPATWHSQIAWVPQHPHLFAGTIADNVRLARPDATDAEVLRALRDAGAPDLSPHALLGEAGTGLSAGQRRRVALARAFLADRPVVLLDEPTAALDIATEARVVDAIARLTRDRTAILIAHRPALLPLADRVIRLTPTGATAAPPGASGAFEPAPPTPEADHPTPGGAPEETEPPTSGTNHPAPAPGGVPEGTGRDGRSGHSSVICGQSELATRCTATAVNHAVRNGRPGPAPTPARTAPARTAPARTAPARTAPARTAPAPTGAPAPAPGAPAPAPGAPGNAPHPLTRVRRIAHPLRARFALALLLGSLALLSAVGLMASSGWLISRASQQPPVLYLMVAVTATRAFGIGRAVFRYAERLVSHDAVFRVLADLRVTVYRRLERLAPAGLRHTRRGDLLSRLVADVDALQDYFLRWLLPAAVAATVSLAATVFTGWLLPEAGAALAAGLLAAGVAVPALAAAVSRRTERRLAPARGELTTRTVDLLTGTAELTVAGALPRRTEAVRDADAALTRLAARSSAVTALGGGLSALAAGLTVTAAAWLGAAAVHGGRLDGLLMAVVVLTPLAAFEAVSGMSLAVQHRQRTRRSAERVHEVIDAPAPVREPEDPAPAPEDPFPLTLTALTARHPGQESPALREVDLTLTPGRRVAVVGPSGSGKTTLAHVLLRFLDPVSGSYTLGANAPATPTDALTPAPTIGTTPTDALTLAPDAVRRLVGLCAQDAHIFDSSLRENLRLARPPATDEDLHAALAAARLDDWVGELPYGLDTLVGEFGARLSGGQRQRLALARALLADFPVLVLDEPAEHLDLATADALTADLLAATEGRTTVLITHRLAGLEAVDEVVVLDGGRVVQHGPYAELARADGPFRRMLERERATGEPAAARA
ncbi:thiol reductant ABC exporter subunit CydD [Streptomyces verrucosisporus]|uniref:thiol reductant ABC exporter subunit CydD n=1 Tax=Streptomyces verrucosisporus TaxID=1695161 RepID=UPI0019CF98E5|nr:thiol reductant ABC exporter subunit CydD [Streptomyces verrucosisporus]MBN3929348.1 thiol reductant ABC exporter subunit CydD [Streptomyces verrucosisporus]